jgi:autotransporter adhesin
VAGGNTFNNVAAAITNIDGRVTNLSNNVTNIVNGGGIKYFHANSTLADSVAAGANSVAIGGAASASAANSVALGANSVADRANTVSVGSSTAQRQIVNLAAGTANTDAVNVGQLKGVTAALGGGAGVNPDGSIQQPTYNVMGGTYTSVGDALSGIDGSTQNLQQGIKYISFGPMKDASGNDLTSAQSSGSYAVAIGGNAFANGSGALAIGTGARALAANAVAVGYGSATSVANTFAVGSATSTRRIVNVSDGVNATALTMIPDVDQGKTIAVGIGGASYKGYAASALGISARITQNIKVKAGAGISAQGTTFGVGGSYQW